MSFRLFALQISIKIHILSYPRYLGVCPIEFNEAYFGVAIHVVKGTLRCSPIHNYPGASPPEIQGIYFRLDRHGFVLLDFDRIKHFRIQ